MNAPRLIPAVLAVFLVAAGLTAGDLYARRVETQYIHALAPQHFPQKDLGAALQAEAFRQPDLLPIYGSSELTIANPYHGSELFKNYPTGFTIFPVGKAGTTDLIILQDLAAVGSDLRGKKVAISLSAPWFFHTEQAADSYAGNFSALHASALAFSTQLSFPVKQEAARRMLEYPKTLEKDALLRFALQRLAGDSVWDRALYYGAWPVGQLRNLIYRLQDHWETLQAIRRQPKLNPAVAHKPAPLDWTKLLDKAVKEQKQNANNNPFGFDNQQWNKKFKNEVPKQKAKTNRDDQFVKSMLAANEWQDLDLLIRSIREMGGQPLILSMPIQGTYYDYTGVTPQARQAYYAKLSEVTKPYGIPVLDFADKDEDKYFLIDPGAHLSREGWIYYDQTLDRFFHGTLR